MKVKAGFLASIVAVILLAALVVWGTGRIADLEREVASLKKAATAKSGPGATTTRARPLSPSPRLAGKTEGGRRTVKTDPAGGEAADEKPERSREEEIGDLIRAFSESEAGTALQNWGNKARAERFFGPLIAEFGFAEEEKGYFLDIVGPTVGAEEALWTKMMANKNKEDRYAILEEYEAATKKRDTELQEFLNDEQDYRRYTEFEARREEYEQMPAIKAALSEAGAPLTEQQEADLVEAMHESRSESGIGQNWEGRGVMNQLEQPGMVERLQTDWATLQSSMGGNVDRVLDPPQREAFDKQQAASLQGLTMGIRFAEAASGGASE